MKYRNEVDGTFILTKCERHKSVKTLLAEETRRVNETRKEKERERKKIKNFLFSHLEPYKECI
jgi:hypothetical protein